MLNAAHKVILLVVFIACKYFVYRGNLSQEFNACCLQITYVYGLLIYLSLPFHCLPLK